MDNFTIAVGGSDCGSSPIMPYIGRRVGGAEATERMKLLTQAALLRCGFDTIELPTPLEPQDAVGHIFRHRADAAIVLSMAAFGSRRTFNDVSGCVARCSTGRFYGGSRVLCEDIAVSLGAVKRCVTSADGNLSGANCVTCIVDTGYVTCFDDMKLALDPDYATAIAEHIAIGVCEYFALPYTQTDDASAYPVTGGSGNATGKRGRKVKLVQTLLSAHGYRLDIDGVFGKNTELAVKTFCANNRMADKLDENFVACITGKERPPFSVGSRSVSAEYANAKLRAKLYDAPNGEEFTAASLAALNELLTDRGKPTLDGDDEMVLSELPELTAIGGGKPRLF